MALFDRVEHVAVQAAEALANIGTPECLEHLRLALHEDVLERPHHLTNAMAKFGDPGFAALLEAVRSPSATVRYHAARGIGSTLREEAVPLLEHLAETDRAQAKSWGLVSTAARDALKTMARVRDAKMRSAEKQGSDERHG
jgi:HEAT repeat protein